MSGVLSPLVRRRHRTRSVSLGVFCSRDDRHGRDAKTTAAFTVKWKTTTQRATTGLRPDHRHDRRPQAATKHTSQPGNDCRTIVETRGTTTPLARVLLRYIITIGVEIFRRHGETCLGSLSFVRLFADACYIVTPLYACGNPVEVDTA